MPGRYDTNYELGQDNLQKFGVDIHHPVFWISSLLVLAFVIGTLIMPGEAKVAFDGAKGWSIANFDWLFMVGANIFVVFCLALIVMPVGKIRIGGAEAKARCKRVRSSPRSPTSGRRTSICECP